MSKGISWLNPASVLPSHFDRALIGYRVEQTGDSHQARAVYSIDKILEVLVDHEGMTPDDAVEWFGFNIEGAYLGPSTPIYVDENAEDEDEPWDE
jgi:hypothetical protein